MHICGAKFQEHCFNISRDIVSSAFWRSKRWANTYTFIHSLKLLMSASKIWTQSCDWWIIIIHDEILVFTPGIDKNQNGKKEKFFKRLPRIYQVFWSSSYNWSPNSVMQWSIYSTMMMCSPFFLQDMVKGLFFNSLPLLLRLTGKSHRLSWLFALWKES